MHGMERNELFPDLFSRYRSCELCPRRCGVDRTAGKAGFCGEGARLRIAAIEAHLGEEPPISGMNGSGTVFFSGCSLRCLYCQNYQISHEGRGREWGLEGPVDRLAMLHQDPGIHNVNFVTPDHFLPHTVAIVEGLRGRGIRIPVLYNLSGYQLVESLRLIQPAADIYLPDFKYADAALARSLSCCPDYAPVALDALAEMVRQKGFLDTSVSGQDHKDHSADQDGTPRIARKGVLVRHLILPGQVENSRQVLDMLFLEFGKDLPLSLMSQYVPIRRFPEAPFLDRLVAEDEFHEILEHAQKLGFRNVFVQHPEPAAQGARPFLPDFGSSVPFPGNVRRSVDH
jgi:putative pyruvate formate lyase activating enzyme